MICIIIIWLVAQFFIGTDYYRGMLDKVIKSCVLFTQRIGVCDVSFIHEKGFSSYCKSLIFMISLWDVVMNKFVQLLMELNCLCLIHVYSILPFVLLTISNFLKEICSNHTFLWLNNPVLYFNWIVGHKVLFHQTKNHNSCLKMNVQEIPSTRKVREIY